MRVIAIPFVSAALVLGASPAFAQDQTNTDGDAGAAPVAPPAPAPDPAPTPTSPAEPTPLPAAAPSSPSPETKTELAYPAAERKNAVQADLGLAVVGLAYERMLLKRIAVQLEAQIFGTWFGPMFDLPNLSGVGAQVRPTWFVTKGDNDGPRGVYLAPFFRLNRVRGEKDYAEGHAVGFSTGLFGGYSFLFADRFNLRVGAGAQYMSYVVVVPAGLDGKDTRLAFKQFFPALDLVVGYTF